MTVKELRDKLAKYSGNLEILVYDEIECGHVSCIKSVAVPDCIEAEGKPFCMLELSGDCKTIEGEVL